MYEKYVLCVAIKKNPLTTHKEYVCGINSLTHITKCFFFHGFIFFLKYTYQWNTNLTCCGKESPSTEGTFLSTK